MDKILITTSSFGLYDHLPLTMLKENGCEPVLNPYGRKLSDTEVKELISEHQPVGIIAGVEKLTAANLERATRLNVISRCGIGMDNVDFDYTNKKQIKVTNTPDGPTIAVAEMTLGLILSLLRQIHVSDASIRSGQWHRPMGNLLNEKSVGVIGCGRIGSHLINLLKAFSCKVMGVDPIAKETSLWKKNSLDDTLNKADIITLHLPYSKENHHIIDKEKLALMKPDAILINASRGGLVDEKALYEVLNEKKLKGAALDCFEEEPYNGMLKQLDNVLMTGHIGSYAIEGRVTMEIQAVKNLLTQLQSE